jgi:ELWxxDGT repeat protein
VISAEAHAQMRIFVAVVAALLTVLVALPGSAAAASMAMVKDINPTGESMPVYLATAGDVVYFSATDGVTGRELWRSDGTSANTYMVRDIRVGAGGSDPRYVASMGGFIYFAARDGIHGHELWKTDGTGPGTVLVKNISPGSAGTWPVYGGTSAGGHVFFNVDNQGLIANYGLWSSDGTAAGTVRVGPWAEQWAGLGNKLFFVDRFGLLWRSDGTATGTSRVMWVTSEVYELATTGTLLYLMTADPANAGMYNVYATDGTKAHMRKLTASPLEYRSWPSLATVADQAFFVDQHRLWRSKGTARTTKVVNTFANDLWEVRGFGPNVWLNTWDAEGFPTQIWCSDGTRAKTNLIDVTPTPLTRDMIAVGPLAFWSRLPYSTWALWQSDGTTAGTIQVASLDVVSATDELFASSVRVYFVLDDGSHGLELWSYPVSGAI